MDRARGKQKKPAAKAVGFFFVRPAGRTYLEVKVLCGPGKGNRKPDGKGVHREVESEGSRRQNAGPTNRNRIEGGRGG